MMKNIEKYKYLLFIITACLAWFLWKNYIRTWLWQYLYAEKTSQNIDDMPLRMNIDLLQNNTPQIVDFDNYDVEIKLRANTEIIARVMYVDIYDSSFYLGLKDQNRRMIDVYNTVSPLDLSIVTGKSATEGNWQKFNIKHEYRTVSWNYKYKDNPIYSREDFNNLHIIPATKSIRKGFDTLKIGDIVLLKGMLIDWREMGEFSKYPYETAKELGEIASFKIGGRISGLCYFVYVTELISGGYIYK